MTDFDQAPYDCRVEWGLRGAMEAAKRKDITIIVDVLSFSTTVVTALEHGAVVYPSPPPLAKAKAYAEAIGAELALSRAEAAALGGYSLSPLSFKPADRGRRIVVCSSNGAACTSAASDASALLIGCLRNAAAAAQAAEQLRRASPPGACVTVVPCGEQWDDDSGDGQRLRPAIEDYLGAGAILARLSGSRSPEAELCAAAFERTAGRLRELIWDCGSGRELRTRGYEQDVLHSTRLDVSSAVPMLVDGTFFADIGAKSS
ncbi:2-phosphosulfolactate phosphatase [Paenibacillus sp. NPDC056579]|uniref:2-phosphosulfolactate phosphatase n=1 Tax=Paenibacillus sp. NPDC056579 TaxID=3345871 RepID=UPI0036C11D2D